jgi:hypothetical protein
MLFSYYFGETTDFNCIGNILAYVYHRVTPSYFLVYKYSCQGMNR